MDAAVEIFTDQYKNNHSNNIFAGERQNKIKICAYGGNVSIRDVESYGLNQVMDL